MQEAYNSKSKYSSDEIDLRDILYVLLKGKWIIVSLTSFISLVGVIYSLLLPNIYESKALLAPVYPTDNISGILKGYGNLTGLAGINLPQSIDEGNSLKAIQKITSLSFFRDNIQPNIKVQDLMAVKSWNPVTNIITYDENIYDSKTNSWVRDYSYPAKQIPSAQEGFKAFKLKLGLSVDLETGFTTVSIKHQSPFLAKEWTELVINEVNSFYRQKDKLKSEKTVSYLNQQILMTTLSEIKQVLAELLQEETKKLALIEANQFYVFDYIDPPSVMERKSEPQRALISIISALLGGFLSIILVLARHYYFTEKNK